MSSVGEQFTKEQARVREILGQFKAIGPAGAIGAALIEGTLGQADVAMASGDLVAILRALEEMRSIRA